MNSSRTTPACDISMGYLCRSLSTVKLRHSANPSPLVQSVSQSCVGLCLHVYKREPNCDRTTRTNLHQWALNSLIGQTACLMTKWERKWACWSERKTETDHVRHSCAHVNKAVEFHYMNLLACQMTDNRVQRRTGLLGKKIYRPVWPRSRRWTTSGRKASF